MRIYPCFRFDRLSLVDWGIPRYRLFRGALAPVLIGLLSMTAPLFPQSAPARAPARASVPRESAPDGCELSGLWRQHTDDVGSSLWTLTALEGNRYHAKEQGLSGAEGTATLNGNLLRVDYKSVLGHAGFFEWRLDPRCARGEGRAVGTRVLVGQRNSRVERIGGKGASGAAATATAPPTLALPPALTLPSISPPETFPPPTIPDALQTIPKPGVAGSEPQCREAPSCGFCLEAGIRRRWRELGGENGPLGCPTMSQKAAFNSLKGTAGQFAEFRGGEGAFIFWLSSGDQANKAFVVDSCHFKVYKAIGTSLSFLGFPISNAYESQEGLRQDFEGGRIAWSATLQTCLALPLNVPTP